MINTENTYTIHTNDKDGNVYAIDENKMAYLVGNLFQPIPEWINKREIIKQIGDIDFSSNKKAWWEAIVKVYGADAFDNNPFLINQEKENINNMNNNYEQEIHVGDRVRISRKAIKGAKCYHPNWESLIAKIINKSPNKMPYVLDVNGEELSIGESEMAWILGTVEIPRNSVTYVEHANEIKERKKTVLKYISHLLKEYHIPHSKKMVLEINEYLDDFMNSMDENTNNKFESPIDYQKSLADKVLNNPELQEEMRKFVIKLMEEAEQEKQRTAQISDNESQSDLDSLNISDENQF